MSLQTVGQQWGKDPVFFIDIPGLSTSDTFLIIPRSYALRGNATVPAKATTQSVGAS